MGFFIFGRGEQSYPNVSLLKGSHVVGPIYQGHQGYQGYQGYQVYRKGYQSDEHITRERKDKNKEKR